MKKSREPRWVWIAWETQRRSVELARELNCELFIFDYSGWFRYPKCCIQTLLVCFRQRPNILFVQNPSMILAVFACFLKFFFNFKLVVDRHSSFRVGKHYTIASDTHFFFRFLDKFFNQVSVGQADLTIITNSFLAEIVEGFGGRPFILPDKLPELKATSKIKLKSRQNILLISSFDLDEPFEEIFQAMILLRNQDVTLYVTGNYKKMSSSLYLDKPDNVIFTGFLSEEGFVNMLFSADVVMALTTSDHTMLCSCYEAVSACKPLITSEKEVLRQYFAGARFVENTASEIRIGIEDVLEHRKQYIEDIAMLKKDIAQSWKVNFDQLVDRLGSI